METARKWTLACTPERDNLACFIIQTSILFFSGKCPAEKKFTSLRVDTFLYHHEFKLPTDVGNAPTSWGEFQNGQASAYDQRETTEKPPCD
ncbi:unnamed protein product [Hymenolepis diminuta]|uniref:Uncharacterized protein n=1 Tax=Hymenolepis diminuta TaxID=6216 RepID=A0A0R3SHZ2_HYMDI|nr:unnamed protein product [Hymenolepis diminuta]